MPTFLGMLSLKKKLADIETRITSTIIHFYCLKVIRHNLKMLHCTTPLFGYWVFSRLSYNPWLRLSNEIQSYMNNLIFNSDISSKADINVSDIICRYVYGCLHIIFHIPNCNCSSVIAVRWGAPHPHNSYHQHHLNDTPHVFLRKRGTYTKHYIHNVRPT
jgi:hypothetical protein